MKLFIPSWAKIISTPAITFFILILLYIAILSNFANENNIDGYPVFLCVLLLSLVFSYALSCVIWTLGKNHRKSLIVSFMILYMFFGAVLSGIIGAFFIQPSIFFFYLIFLLPILILLIGIMLYVKESKKNKQK